MVSKVNTWGGGELYSHSNSKQIKYDKAFWNGQFVVECAGIISSSVVFPYRQERCCSDEVHITSVF